MRDNSKREALNPAKMKYAVTWLFLACASALLLGQLNWIGYQRLVRRGIRVDGTVAQVLPQMHATVRYNYEAGGRRYDGQTQPWPPNPPIEGLTSGAKVTVYYDPQNPEKSVLGSPNELLKNETITIAIVVLVVPTMIVLAWRYGIFSRLR